MGMMGYVVSMVSVVSVSLEADTESSLGCVQLKACEACAASATNLMARRN
jgi:hypothetical protein